MSGEEYVAPVGFAREPVVERRRWIGRLFLAIVVVLLLYLVFTRVIHVTDTQPTIQQSTLPRV